MNKEENNIVWARLSSLYAGDKTSVFFRPEEGDEVVLGFLNDDPRHAIILGSLHSSSKHPPPETFKVEKENSVKGIATKAGMSIEFNDKEKTFKISLNEKNYLFMDEKGIQIKDDTNKNSIVLSDKGIEIKDDTNKNSIILDDKGLNIDVSKDIMIKGKSLTYE